MKSLISIILSAILIFFGQSSAGFIGGRNSRCFRECLRYYRFDDRGRFFGRGRGDFGNDDSRFGFPRRRDFDDGLFYCRRYCFSRFGSSGPFFNQAAEAQESMDDRAVPRPAPPQKEYGADAVQNDDSYGSGGKQDAGTPAYSDGGAAGQQDS
jgi:hypothetical protein